MNGTVKTTPTEERESLPAPPYPGGASYVRIHAEEYRSGHDTLRQVEAVLYLFRHARAVPQAQDGIQSRSLIIAALLADLNHTALSCLELPPQH